MSERHWEPTCLGDFVGQSSIVAQLKVEIAASRRQQRPMHHLILGGPQGLGKTLLCELIARERGCPVTRLMGNTLTPHQFSLTMVQLASPGYTNGGVLTDPAKAVYPTVIVDEIERVDRVLMETMHPLLERHEADQPIIFMATNERGEARRVWVVRFQMIFITNYPGELHKRYPAALSRFPLRFNFAWYQESELVQLLVQYADRRGIKLAPKAAQKLATISSGSARIAQNQLTLAYDYACADGGAVTEGIVDTMMKVQGIAPDGMRENMLTYLRTLAKSPTGRMSLDAITSMLGTGTDPTELSSILEPALMQRGYIFRTSGGRGITPEGLARIGLGRAKADDPFNLHAVEV
jgi:Holliday junction DNA helicase RuvB